MLNQEPDNTWRDFEIPSAERVVYDVGKIKGEVLPTSALTLAKFSRSNRRLRRSAVSEVNAASH